MNSTPQTENSGFENLDTFDRIIFFHIENLGTQGKIAWDASYMYVCTATDTWKRSGLSTW